MGAILLCIVRMLWAAVIGPAPLLLGRLSWSVSAAIDAAYDGGGGRGGLRSGFGGSVSRARARGLELLSSASLPQRPPSARVPVAAPHVGRALLHLRSGASLEVLLF